MVAVEQAFRRVDWDVIEVDAQPVPLRVAIGEKPDLQHLARREADPGDTIGRRERDLLDLGEEVFGVPVQLEIAHLDQRIIGFRPDLGEVERIERESLGLLVGHDLNKQGPAREVAALDAVEKVALVHLPILADQGSPPRRRIRYKCELRSQSRKASRLRTRALALVADLVVIGLYRAASATMVKHEPWFSIERTSTR